MVSVVLIAASGLSEITFLVKLRRDSVANFRTRVRPFLTAVALVAPGVACLSVLAVVEFLPSIWGVLLDYCAYLVAVLVSLTIYLAVRRSRSSFLELLPHRAVRRLPWSNPSKG